MKSICTKMPQKSYYETNFFWKKKKNLLGRFILVAHKGEKEIGAIFWRLLDNPGEWHYTVPCTYILINIR